MIKIYKEKNKIPCSIDYIELNDIFFNQNTASKIDNNANKIIEYIDNSKLISQYKIKSKFNETVLDIDQLSTGCKTALNVYYFPDKIFCIKECGNNALEMIYQLEKGMVYSDYAMIPFNIVKVEVCNGTMSKIIDNYEELKEWWDNEK